MSKWIAVDAVEESFDRTKELLLPLKLGFWLKLALVVVLVEGLSMGDSQNIVNEGGGLGPAAVAFIAVMVAVALFIGLIFSYVSAVMQFEYVNALVRKEIRLIAGFKRYAGEGLRLFLFQVGAGLVFVVLLVAAALAGVFVAAAVNNNLFNLALIVLGVILVIFSAIAFTLVMWSVTEFVVPLVYAKGIGLLDGLREVKSLVEADFWQFIVYLGLKFLLGLVAGIVVFAISFVFFLGLFGGAALVGLGAYLGLSSFGSVGGGVTAALIVTGVLTLMLLTLVVRYVVTCITLPVSVFFRYYGLVFLQRLNVVDLFKPVEKDKPEKLEDSVRVY